MFVACTEKIQGGFCEKFTPIKRDSPRITSVTSILTSEKSKYQPDAIKFHLQTQFGKKKVRSIDLLSCNS